MKKNRIKRLLDNHFSLFIYCFCLLVELAVLYSARANHLLPMPMPGTDQLSMLNAASDIYNGQLPSADYKMSMLYTLFIYLYILISSANLVAMRIIQAVICALLPVVIYKLSVNMRMGRSVGQLAALLYCFYAPSILISLSFLRASPLALTFIAGYLLFTKGVVYRKAYFYIFAGIAAGMTILFRPNFIPVVFLPVFIFIISKLLKKNYDILNLKTAALYFGTILLTILPLISYNAWRIGEFTLFPGLYSATVNTEYGAATFQTILIKTLTHFPENLYNFIGFYDIENSLSIYAHKELIPLLQILIIPFNLMLALGIVASFRYWRKLQVLALASGFLAYMFSIALVIQFYRFRIPVVPILCILTSLGIIYLVRNIRKRRVWFALLFVLAFFVVTYSSPEKRRPLNEKLAVVTVMTNNKDFYAAETRLSQITAKSPLSKEIEKRWIFLGRKLHEDGQTERAVQIINRWREIQAERNSAAEH